MIDLCGGIIEMKYPLIIKSHRELVQAVHLAQAELDKKCYARKMKIINKIRGGN